MIDPRGFLAGILALGAAPAIVRAQSLMPVAPKIIASKLYVGEVGEFQDITISIDELQRISSAAHDPGATGELGRTIRFRRWMPRLDGSVGRSMLVPVDLGRLLKGT